MTSAPSFRLLPVEATEAMIDAASRAVVSEWRAMIIEILDRATPGEPERAFISPGNFRLIRASLNAALAIAAGQLGEKESGDG